MPREKRASLTIPARYVPGLRKTISGNFGADLDSASILNDSDLLDREETLRDLEKFEEHRNALDQLGWRDSDAERDVEWTGELGYLARMLELAIADVRDTTVGLLGPGHVKDVAGEDVAKAGRHLSWLGEALNRLPLNAEAVA